jgi:hypothetical protein
MKTSIRQHVVVFIQEEARDYFQTLRKFVYII